MIWQFILIFMNIANIYAWLPKIVWTYWQDQLQQADHQLLIFQNNHRQFITNDWQLRFLNKKTVWYWLNQIPDFGDTLNTTEFQQTLYSNRANLIRIALIKHYGGVWMDFSMILLEGLDWILDINSSKLLNNRLGQHPDMLFCTENEIQKKSAFHDIETDSTFYIQPDLETFFIAAIPQAKLAIQVYQYYKQGHFKPKQYDLFGNQKNYFVQNALKNNYSTGHYVDIPYFQFAISFHSVIDRKQRQLDKKWSGSLNQKRQLAVKYYNIWTMPSNLTSYKLQRIKDSQQHFNEYVINILMQSDIEYLKKADLFPSHFVKLSQGNRQILFNYFLDSQQQKNLVCQDEMFIHENSIAYKYLLENYPIKFYENNLLKYSFYRRCVLPIKFVDRGFSIIIPIITTIVLTIIFVILSILIYKTMLNQYQFQASTSVQISEQMTKLTSDI